MSPGAESGYAIFSIQWIRSRKSRGVAYPYVVKRWEKIYGFILLTLFVSGVWRDCRLFGPMAITICLAMACSTPMTSRKTLEAPASSSRACRILYYIRPCLMATLSGLARCTYRYVHMVLYLVPILNMWIQYHTD